MAGQADIIGDPGRAAPRPMSVRKLRQAEIERRYSTADLLMVFEPSASYSASDIVGLMRSNGDAVRAAMLEHGGVLFRGFSIPSAQEFQEAIRACGLNMATDYDFGMTKRKQLGKNLFSATDYSQHLMIPPHCEMAYRAIRPSWLALYCETAASMYGETPVFDMAQTLVALPAELQDRLMAGSLTYVRPVPARAGFLNLKRTIEEIFQSTDREVIEEKARAMGVETRWLKPDLLEIRTTLPAVVVHPDTGRPCLNIVLGDLSGQEFMFKQFRERFNKAEWMLIKTLLRMAERSSLSSLNRILLDGEPLTKQEVGTIFDRLFANAVTFPWREGDIVMLDTITTAHARVTYKGRRNILACFGDLYDVRDL